MQVTQLRLVVDRALFGTPFPIEVTLVTLNALVGLGKNHGWAKGMDFAMRSAKELHLQIETWLQGLLKKRKINVRAL